jgi:Zn-dependent protease
MNKRSIWYFSKKEKTDLIISWITLSIAFALVINPIFLDITSLILSLPIAFVAVGTGFVFHEIAHRQAARHYKFHSEFRMWKEGLFFAIGIAVISGGQFIFAAPGATYFFGNNVTLKQNGIISAAGPIINIILGLILTLIGLLILDPFFKLIFVYSALINYWFALFNLIPIYPLDGSKIFRWNPKVWVLLIAVAGFLVFGPI